MKWYGIIGLFAAVCIAVYMIPQLYKTLKTKDTSGISIAMFVIALLGDLFFVINGIGILCSDAKDKVSAGLPILLANLAAFIISAIIAFYKFRNMYRARKLNVTEKTFCANYKDSVAKYKADFKKNKPIEIKQQ